MSRLLANKVALITGASSGIGQATVRRFAQEGATVIALARRRERLEELAREYPGVTPFACDVTDHAALEQCVRQAVTPHGRIDVLVNNAGFSYYQRHTDSTLEQWRQTMAVNLEAYYVLAQRVVPYMIRQRYGRIVNVSSTQALGRPYPKALYNVLAMIHRLVGTRVEALAGRTVPCIASADKASKRLTVLLWNYHARMPESAAPIDYSSRQSVVLRLRDARAFFGGTHVRFRRWLVSRTVSNAYYLWKHGKLNAHHAALQQVDSGEFQIVEGKVDIGFSMPPSSVSLVEVDAETGTGRNGKLPEAKSLGRRGN